MSLQNNESIWISSTDQPETPNSKSQGTYDVVIVGAGIVGVSLAYRLRKSGSRVLLVEALNVLRGVTGFTTGKLTAQHGLIYSKVRKSQGDDTARTYNQAQQWAIEQVDSLVREHAIACDLCVDDAHIYSTEEANDASMEEESAAYRDLGIEGELVAPTGCPEGARKLLRMRNQRHFHPRNFLLKLLELAIADGVHVISKNRVLKVTEEQDCCVIETERGTIRAQQVAVTSHYPVHDSGLFIAKLSPIRSYAAAFRYGSDRSEGMFITHDDEPLRSWRPAKFYNEDVLIVGSVHHKVGEAPDEGDAYAELEAWARKTFTLKERVARWSTQDNWTPDDLPFIGKSPNRERVLLAAGFGGWGMTNGIVASHLLADAVEGRDNPWADVFSPGRLNLGMVPKLVKENLGTVSHLVGDKVARVPELDPDSVPVGEGAIGMIGSNRRAIYNDPHDGVCILNPRCTHMGCQLMWNTLESTWDCPCHGSRFTATGEVIHGPAVTALELIVA